MAKLFLSNRKRPFPMKAMNPEVRPSVGKEGEESEEHHVHSPLLFGEYLGAKSLPSRAFIDVARAKEHFFPQVFENS